MCFSATASFVASGILAFVGMIAYTQVKNKNQFLFASIPLLFAIQQFAEGFVWLSFTHAAFAPWHTVAKYIFLLFAMIIWPVWIPLSVYCLEWSCRSPWLKYTVFVGAIVSLYLATGLMRYEVVATMFDCHIRYYLPIGTSNVYISSFLYLCATIAPFFYARTRYMRFFGILFGLSYVISYFFYYCVLVSVWCFFCALLSISVVLILRNQIWIASCGDVSQDKVL